MIQAVLAIDASFKVVSIDNFVHRALKALRIQILDEQIKLLTALLVFNLSRDNCIGFTAHSAQVPTC